MLLLSADDLLLPGAFRRATALMDAHPNVGMIYGNAVFTDDPRRDAYHGPAAVGWKILTGHAYIAASCRRAGNLVPTPTAVVRTAVQHRIGGYRKDLTHSGDMEMWLRFAAHGDIGVLDAYQAYYRQHPTNMSNGYKGLGDLRQRALAFEALFHRDGNRLPEPGYHLQVAKERLSREALDQAYEAFEAGNNDLSKEYLRFAVAMSHRARFRRLYWRLRGKLVLGQRWLSYLRPWYRRVLARNRARSNNPLVNTPAPIS
jgi:hypothetical protein